MYIIQDGNDKEKTMKTNKNKNLLIIAALIMSFSLVGCSSKKSSSGTTNTVSGDTRNDNTGNNTGSNTAPDDSNWGAEGFLDIDDTNAFKEFSGMTTEDLKNERIYLKLDKVIQGGKTYFEGEVRIAYDYEYIHNQFSSNPGMVETIYKNPRFVSEQYSEEELDDNPRHLDEPIQGIRFNTYFTKSGRKYLVGFFEEPDFYDYSPWNWDPAAKAGAVMIIINNPVEGSDDGWSGSVWFHNYDFTYAVKPTFTRCWDIEIGPFSCRDFVVNDKIQPNLDITPNNFTKLGEFYNLSESAILGN